MTSRRLFSVMVVAVMVAVTVAFFVMVTIPLLP